MTWLTRWFVVTVLLSAACFAEPAFEAKQLHFKSGFGSRGGDPIVYCILGTGFFRAPRTDDFDQLVTAWLSSHPDAQVTLVDTAPAMGRPGSKMGRSSLQYIWIEDGDEKLNVFLVREGAVTGGVMEDLASFFNSLKVTLPAGEELPTRLVTDEKYAAFLNQVAEAEELARQDKRGLWSDKYSGLMDSLGLRTDP
jgi:hypothetical protein